MKKINIQLPFKAKKRITTASMKVLPANKAASPIKAKKTAKNSHFICLMKKSILLECPQTRVMYLFIMQENITISSQKGQRALRCCSLLRKCIVSM